MLQDFYVLPLTLEKITQKQELDRCSLQQSVMQHLHLLLTTSFGEFPADGNFGCGVWDHDFDIVSSANKLKDLIRDSLLVSIAEHEKRLGNVRLEVVIRQEEISGLQGGRRMKKKIDITVTGVLKLTNERFSYKDRFFVGPLSY